MHITSVASQPIFTADLAVQGYELLFRGERTPNIDGVTMTSQVILSALLDIGLPQLVGKSPAFLNVRRSMLLERVLLCDTDGFRSDQIVIEILEDTLLDDELAEALQEHSRAGFRLALDDYTAAPYQDKLLPFVDIVKVDLPGLPAREIARRIVPLRGNNLQLLAEKVETREQLAVCQYLGFDLYQGYLLSRPVTVSRSALSPSRLICLELLKAFSNKDASASEIEEIVKNDPGLALQVLRAASLGASGGLRRTLRSVTEAVVLLGIRRMTSLVMLTLMAGENSAATEQVKIAMTRARMCERLAAVTTSDSDMGYTVGLLSAMDLLLDMPLASVLERASLEENTRTAVLDRSGIHGELLGLVLAYETGEDYQAERLNLTDRQVTGAYLDAVGYSHTLLGAMQAAR